MNKLLKYGLPSALGLLLATPVMAQTNNPGDQTGYQQGQTGYQQGPSAYQPGQTGYQQGQNMQGQGNWQSSQNNGYDENHGPNQRVGENATYGNQGNQASGQNYGQNGYGSNNPNYGQNSNTGQAGNNPNTEVTQGLMAQVQHSLQQRGFYHQGNVDGVWGPATSEAISAFQQHNNLHRTGQLDVPTLEALNVLNAPNNNQMYGQNENYRTYQRNGNQGQNYSSNNNPNMNADNGNGNSSMNH
jgi:hypothetical protein